jgi:hypothetical protein
VIRVLQLLLRGLQTSVGDDRHPTIFISFGLFSLYYKTTACLQ